MEYKVTIEQLKKLQNLSMQNKVNVSHTRIIDAILSAHFKVYVAFSGGKDSTVLLHMVANCWKLLEEQHGGAALPVIFADTGNEYNAITKFVPEYCKYIERTVGIKIDLHMERARDENGKIITFIDVCQNVGYPIASKKISKQVNFIRKEFKRLDYFLQEVKEIIKKTQTMTNKEQFDYFNNLGLAKSAVLGLTGINSKGVVSQRWRISNRWKPLIYAPFECSQKCCDYLKKDPAKHLAQSLGLDIVFTGEMASDGYSRKNAYLNTGCNAFVNGKGKSKPMGFWQEQDVLKYIKRYKLPFCKVYGELVETDNGQLKFTKAQRTGCKLCLFGIQMGDAHNNRIMELYDLEPATVKFAFRDRKQGGLGYNKIFKYMGKRCGVKIDLPKIEE